MLTLTDAALQRLREAMQAKNMLIDDYAIRVKVTGRAPGGFKYDFRSVPRVQRSPDDIVLDMSEMPLYIDPASLAKLRGATIDVRPEGGFKIDNPNPVFNSALEEEVATIIETQINPGVSLHGGQIVLVDVQDHTAYITMEGGCKGCSLALATMKQGVEKMIREAVPAIHDVIDVTAHDEGANPFFRRPDEGESPLTKTQAGG